MNIFQMDHIDFTVFIAIKWQFYAPRNHSSII